MKSRYLSVLFTLLVLGLSSVAVADVPQILHYQGFLTDASGNAVDCPDSIACPGMQYSMTFRLYDSTDGDTVLWQESFIAVPIRDGIFDVLLGSTNPIDESVFDLDTAYLGLSINDTDELLPRQRLVSAAYAIRAGNAENATTLGGKSATDFVASDDIAGLCITDEELATLLAEKNYCTECYSNDDVAIYLTDNGFVAGASYTDAQVQAYLDAQGYVSGPHTVDTVLTEQQVDDMANNNGYASQTALDALAPSQWTAEAGRIQANNAANVVVTDTGNVGVGTQTPGARLDVAGGVKLGNTDTCNAATAGTLRWTGSTFEGCDGTKWSSLGGGGGPPAGTIMGWATGFVPPGYLECDGSTQLRADYPALFAAIGTRYGSTGLETFILPDFRGEFLRGWSHATGKDPNAGGRTDRGDGTTGDQVGTKQGSANQSHNHKIGRWSGGYPGYSLDDPTQDNAVLDDGNSGENTTHSGGSESRPRNVNVMWVIKL